MNVHGHPSWREAWLPESEAKKNPSTSLLGIFSGEQLSPRKYAERKSMLDQSIATHPPKNAASVRTEIPANREKSRSSVRRVGAPCSGQTAATMGFRATNRQRPVHQLPVSTGQTPGRARQPAKSHHYRRLAAVRIVSSISSVSRMHKYVSRCHRYVQLVPSH